MRSKRLVGSHPHLRHDPLKKEECNNLAQGDFQDVSSLSINGSANSIFMLFRVCRCEVTYSMGPWM